MNASIKPNLVSTIIPVFNRPQMVVESIDSVLAQTYRPIEIIVVDDGSTDSTPQVLKALAEQHAELRIYAQKNKGPGAARELGRQHALGEFIQYHDSDDLLCENKFTSQVAALQADLAADVAYGKTERCLIGASLKGVPLKGTGTYCAAMFPASLRSRWWSTSTPLYRRSVTDRAGAWMSTSNEEDWEYDCRVAALGGRLVFVDEFVSITRAHTDHLHFDGTLNPTKLDHRCAAQAKIFEHAKAYMCLAERVTDIQYEDWQFYSKSVFLLARECAAAGLLENAKRMMALSIEAAGGASVQHRVYGLLARFLGWKRAARLVKGLGK